MTRNGQKFHQQSVIEPINHCNETHRDLKFQKYLLFSQYLIIECEGPEETLDIQSLHKACVLSLSYLHDSGTTLTRCEKGGLDLIGWSLESPDILFTFFFLLSVDDLRLAGS